MKVKAGPSTVWYVAVMLGFMVAGLAWLVVYYLAADYLTWMTNLGA